MGYIDNTGFLKALREKDMSIADKARAIAEQQRAEARLAEERGKTHAQRAYERFVLSWSLLQQAVIKELDGVETVYGTLNVTYRDYNPQLDWDQSYVAATAWVGTDSDRWSRHIDFEMKSERSFVAKLKETQMPGVMQEFTAFGKTIEELFYNLPPLLARWM